jgi:hypothetical protein
VYDKRCEELAEYFLADWPHKPKEVNSLAQEIQDSIERWFEPRQFKPKDVTP